MRVECHHDSTTTTSAFGAANGLANLALIGLSKTLFSYQIFIVAESTPDVNFVLADTKARSETRAKNLEAEAAVAPKPSAPVMVEARANPTSKKGQAQA